MPLRSTMPASIFDGYYSERFGIRTVPEVRGAPPILEENEENQIPTNGATQVRLFVLGRERSKCDWVWRCGFFHARGPIPSRN